MNLEIFIKSLSEEEINELRELLKVEPEKLNKIPTFLEIYEKARESREYNKKIYQYRERTGKRLDFDLTCSACGALHYLEAKGVPSTIAHPQWYREFHYKLIRIPSIGKTTIEYIENWFEWYYKDFIED